MKELNKKVHIKNKKVLAGKRLVLINMAKQMWALHLLSHGWNKWYFRSHLDTDYQTSKFILTVWKHFPGVLILSQCAIYYWIFSPEAKQLKKTCKQHWQAHQIQSIYNFHCQCYLRMKKSIINGAYIWYPQEFWYFQKYLHMKQIENLCTGKQKRKNVYIVTKISLIPMLEFTCC